MRGVRRGFTLIEALVALTVLGVAVVAATGAFAGGFRAQRAVERHGIAVALADARLAEMELYEDDSLASYGRARDGRFAPPFDAYRWRAIVRRDSVVPALVGAAVLVAWERGEYTLETTFYRPAPVTRALAGGTAR